MKINNISARKILDSRGEWTIEVSLKTADGSIGTVGVPQGKSTGSNAAVYVSVEKAIENVEKIIAPKIKGMDVENQIALDEALILLDGTPRKSKLGANAILGVSLAAAKAAAASKNIPLWKYIKDIQGNNLDNKLKLFINCINGGKHANNSLRFQEYIIIPDTFDIEEAIEVGDLFYDALGEYLKKEYGGNAINLGDEGGYTPDLKEDAQPFEIFSKVAENEGLKVKFGIDVAASNIKASPSELESIYINMKSTYPLVYIEDPFDEEDFESFRKLTSKIGREVDIAGDDLTVTSVELMKKAKEKGSCNAVIIKPNQIGTLTETLKAINIAREWGWKVVVSHRSGETVDDFIADLAIGVKADGFKLGAPARGERVAKYNRLLEIVKEQV